MRVILVLLAMLLLYGQAKVQAAGTLPVHIDSGTQQGQGLLVPSTNSCFVVTAGHVAVDAAATMISKSDGVRAAVSKISRARGLDVALLSFEQMSIGAQAGLCQFSSSFYDTKMLRLSDAGASKTFFGVRVSTRAGGLVYLPLRLVSSSGDQLRFAVRADAAIVQSDSGMPIWLFQRKPSPQYDAREFADGRLAGIVLAVEGQEIVAAKAERVSQAVYDVLNPPSSLRVADSQLASMISFVGHGPKASDAERGRPSSQDDVFHNRRNLGTTSIQFDLGNSDTVFSGYSFRSRTLRGYPNLLVNQFRPKDGSKWAYARQSCKSTLASASIECRLHTPQIVRGIWLDISSPAAGIENLQLNIARAQ